VTLVHPAASSAAPGRRLSPFSFWGHTTAGLDRRTLRSPAYRASQIVRKRIEQFFGWGKSVGGTCKTRLKGVRRNAQLLYLTGAAYNLLRISRMCPAPG
jgi:hypothetical protein